MVSIRIFMISVIFHPYGWRYVAKPLSCFSMAKHVTGLTGDDEGAVLRVVSHVFKLFTSKDILDIV